MTTPLGLALMSLGLVALAWVMERKRDIRDAMDRHPAGSALDEPCQGCGAESGEECHWHCLSWEDLTDA